MSWDSRVTIGGFDFREELSVQQQGQSVTVSGQEAHPPASRAQVAAAAHNVSQMIGQTVPVLFDEKTELSGFYLVTDARATLLKFADSMLTAAWEATLVRLGTAHDVEVESRVPTIARLVEVAGAPAAVYWHAPASGTTSYYTGPTAPAGTVVRTSADGPVNVYTGIPVGIAPRWTVSEADYLDGSARVLFDGVRRLGVLTPPLAVWEVNNGLARVRPGISGAFEVSCWDPDTAAWSSPKGYQATVNGTAQTGTPELSILRNDPEQVVFRLTYPVTAAGRVAVDLSLRRGARSVTGVVKRHGAATLGITRDTAEAATAVTGGLRATSADADGNRFAMGSTRIVTTTTATASIAKAAVLSLDFFLGHEVGSAPQTGDAFADLFAQYLGSAGEHARVVRR